MDSKFKYLIILSIILISLTLLNVSFASDNLTEDFQASDDAIEVESIDYESNVSSTNGDLIELSVADDIEKLNSTKCDNLTTYVPYYGVNIYNPDFEDGLNGWNYEGSVFAGGNYAHNGAKSAHLDPSSSISQLINFNVIDSINIWVLSYTFIGSGVNTQYYNDNYIEIYADDVLLLNTTLPSVTYVNRTIDVSKVNGSHYFKIVTGPRPSTNGGNSFFTYLDDFTIVRNDVIDPYYHIISIDVDDNKNISVSFVDDSFGFISSWLWDFGDGTVSTEKNPTHIYTEPGVYTITETISDGNQFVETNKTVNIKDIFSVDFSNNGDVGYKNLFVQFSEKSSGEINNWFWDFGDGTNSSDKNPVHTYSGAGNYNVSLTVSNEAKSLNITKSDLICVCDDLTADFTSTADENTYSFVVNFTDSSIGNPTNWLWDFGDNTTSTDKNPTHKYSSIGNYNVTLTVYSPYNTTNITKTISVKAKESYITITNINKRLLVTGVLKNKDDQVIPNELVTYELGNVNGSTISDDSGVFTIQGIPNTNLTINFNGNNDTLNCEYETLLGDIQIKNTVISVSNPYKLVVADSGAGEKAKTFTFYLKDSDGNVLPYKGLRITLTSGSYDIYTDVNGKVSLSIKVTTAKTYYWKITFAGDDDYNGVTKTAKVVVSKKSSKITPKKTSYTFKKSAKTKYVYATLKTSNKYLKTGKKVTLTVGGKKYTVKAGKNGAIKFNIGSLKKKGTYKVKIKFAGDSTYKACTSSQIKIKIK